jgi:hypothetical protein
VREPAPVIVSDEAGNAPAAPPRPLEMPQPVVSSAADTDEGGRPRRSGWWNRRAIGKG